MEIKLQSTLLHLMKNYNYDKITVKLICETAKVNRSTFYAHFADIRDMLEHMQNYLSEEMINSYASIITIDGDTLSGQILPSLVHHVKEHHFFYKISLAQQLDFPSKKGYEKILEILAPFYTSESEADFQYYFTYFQAGLTMVLRRWVENDCFESEEYMVKLLENCIPAFFK